MSESDSQSRDRILVLADPDLKDLIPGFLINRREDLVTLQRALKEEDYETLRFVAHDLKGTGAGYGFDYISTAGRFLEIAAKNRDLAGAWHWLANLRDYMNRIQVVYN